MEKLICPHCGYNLASDNNSIYRNLDDSEVFSWDKHSNQFYFNHAVTNECTGYMCSRCNNNVDDLLEEFNIGIEF